MATLTKAKTGKLILQFTSPVTNRRHTIRMGSLNKKQADSVQTHVEHLVSCSITGAVPDDHTSYWISGLSDDFHSKLVACGLVSQRDTSKTTTIGKWTQEYIESRTDLKPLTRKWLQHAARFLCQFLGAEKKLMDVTPSDGDDFRRWLGERLGENSVRRHLGRAKQFFRAAVRKRLISESPFAELKGCNVKANPERFFNVTRELSQQALDACPDSEWRAIFALARFGGLRCPSEVIHLKWSDIDWDKGRIRVTSPKTAHHEGKEYREVPLFPELHSVLAEHRKIVPNDSVLVVARCLSEKTNLRTQFIRILKKAGVTPWPKLFQNCRSTRETELAKSNPLHVVCAWFGNSPRVATAHYLQVTDSDFEEAIQTTSAGIKESLQNPTQYTAAFSGIELQAGTENLYELACSEFLAVFDYPRQDSNKASSQTTENALKFGDSDVFPTLDSRLSAAKALLLERVRNLVVTWLRCPESVRDQVCKLMQETQPK